MELHDALAARFDRLKSGDDGWQALADAGVLGLPFAEAHGGLGLPPRDGFAVLEALGPRAIALPYLECVLLAGTLLDRAGCEAAAHWLPRVATGDAKLALASIDDREPALAEVDPAGWRLSGGKLLAIGAAEADAVIVIAATGDGTAAFLIAREALAMKAYPTIDGRSAADLLLDDVTVPAEARLEVGPEDIAEILDLGAAAIAAEAAAIMARLVADTRDYCVQREQFGKAISSFQVVQHRLVDMHIEARRAAAAAALAADALDLDPAERAKAISAAKVTIADAGRFVGQNAVQLHGGMGMTEELPVSAFFKRLTVIESEFGTRDEHLARYMALT
ncbi:acyl-CoA dehydrogenase family protein [Sphingopyxis sp.]|uniref:acyl-CoA dehydrogenase family protein n=1 Tax=Sphingopyxis sp. TaxID=1908224 RepID=UPI003D0AE943